MTFDADRSDVGILHLQDHRDSMPVGRRSYVAGVRVREPGGDDDRFAGWLWGEGEAKQGTLGDLHPWRFFEPGSRDMGAWAQFMVGRVTGSAFERVNEDIQGRPITGAPERANVSAVPVRTASFDPDGAFEPAGHAPPPFFNLFPKGYVVGLAAGTQEDKQQDLAFSLDPRLIAVHKHPRDESGTWVCDLDSAGALNDGPRARRARLQTLTRVALTQAVGDLGMAAGPTACWLHDVTGQARQGGMGAIYGRLEAQQSRGPGDTTNPPGRPPPDITPSAGGGTTIGLGDTLREIDGLIQQELAGGAGGGGALTAFARNRAVAYMSWQAWGGIHPGCRNDRHQLGVTDDGEPMHSSHLAVDRHLFFRDQNRDAPLEFDRTVYGPVQAPLRTRAWIRYDVRSTHPWVGGQTLPGLWRLEAESYFTGKDGGGGPPSGGPPSGGPPGPQPPPRPPPDTTPNPDTPNGDPTPGGPAPTPTPPRPGGSIHPGRPPGDITDPPDGPDPGGGHFDPGFNGTRVLARADASTHRPEHVVWSPAQLGFGNALIFPQHYGRAGSIDLRYSTGGSGGELEREILSEGRSRPAVLRIMSFAKEAGQDFDYTQRPGRSRVPGGTATGLVLVAPPEVDEMDAVDSFAPAGVTRSSSGFGWADGAYAAWGVADETGALASGGFRASRTSAGGADSVLAFTHFDGTDWNPILSLVSAGGERGAVAEGNYFQFPLVAAADLPASPSPGMVVFNNDDSEFQGWDGSSWVAFGGGGGGSTASTTEVLTGTDAAKSVTPDSLAALWEKGSDISSAATISVGEGGLFHVTGTTSISDIDFATDKAGRTAKLRFDDTLNIVHSANLICPEARDLVVHEDDVVIVVSEGSDVVRVIAYLPAFPKLLQVINADETGSNVNTAQPWFPNNPGVDVKANTLYAFKGFLRTSRSAGNNNHTTSFLLGGTATYTRLKGEARCKSGDTAGLAAHAGVALDTHTATVVKAASTSATEQTVLVVEGHVWVNNVGTLIPQFQYSAAPGGAPTIEDGTYFQLTPIGADSVEEVGNWS